MAISATNWRFHLDRHWMGNTKLHVQCLSATGRAVVGPLTLTIHKEGEAVDTAMLTETDDDAVDGRGDVTGFLQAALECAWANGMRPRSFSDHTNELTAVRYHLEDMRKLAKVKA